jgi:hypothetical protein
MQSTINSSSNPYSEIGALGFEELNISLVGNQINATVLQLDFLKMSGIIPSDWEVQKQPVLTATYSQIIFKNGVNLVAQARSITLNQTIDPTNKNPLVVPQLAGLLVDKLPNANYQGVSINPKILIAFTAGGTDVARNYIVERVLAPGPWLNMGQAPVQASVNFFYQLDRCKLLLNLNQAQIQQPNQQSLSALLFTGSFNYELGNYTPDERLQQLKQRIENWSTDLQTLRDIVTNRFLGQQDNVFPV